MICRSWQRLNAAGGGKDEEHVAAEGNQRASRRIAEQAGSTSNIGKRTRTVRLTAAQAGLHAGWRRSCACKLLVDAPSGRVYASTRDAGSGGQRRGSAPPQQTAASLHVATSLAGFTKAALIVCSAPSDKRRHVQRVVAAAIKPHRGSASQSCRSRTRQKLTCQPFVPVCDLDSAAPHQPPIVPLPSHPSAALRIQIHPSPVAGRPSPTAKPEAHSPCCRRLAPGAPHRQSPLLLVHGAAIVAPLREPARAQSHVSRSRLAAVG